MENKSKASELFKCGYNCSQAVFCAYCEDLGINLETGLKLSSSFGGGMGRMREVCGAVSAMFMILGLKQGYTTSNDNEAKTAQYEKIQRLAKIFREKFGTIICRELLNNPDTSPVATKRTPDFYETRPCLKFIEYAGQIIEKEILNK